jgi:hypothetical protein
LFDIVVALLGPNVDPASFDASAGVTTWQGSIVVATAVGPGDSAGASEGAVDVVAPGVAAVDGSNTATDGRTTGIEGPVVPPVVEVVQATRLATVRTRSARVAPVAIGRGWIITVFLRCSS